jgi:uncharacterized caspase-like protein
MQRFSALFVGLILVFVSQCRSQSRHALVIGNDTYPGNELRNARNDARGVYDALHSVGYDSTLALDVDRPNLSSVIDRFVDSIKPGDTALLYYAGHGLQVAGENFLVPVDFKVTTTAAVQDEGYSLSSVLERFTSHGAVTQIVILDSCRDNPFLGTRSTKGGWAPLGTSAGSFLAFGTSPGSTASDDPSGSHGLFTKDLLPLLTNSNLDIEEMFRLVREAVIRDSNGQQVPWIASSLIGTFHLRPELDLTDRFLPKLGDNTIELSPVYTRSIATGSPTQGDGSLPQTPEQAAKELVSAITLSRSGRFREAVSLLQHVLTVVPNSMVASHLLGLALHETGRDEEAINALDEALRRNPSDTQAAAYKCAIEGYESLSIAEQDCETILRNNPSAAVYLAYAGVLFANGDDQRAYTQVTQSIALRPSNLGFALRGAIAAQQGQHGAAERDFLHAAENADLNTSHN